MRCRIALALVLVLCPALALAAAPPGNGGLSEKQIADGWIALFDGNTTFGWSAEGKAKWSAADGVLSTEGAESGWIATNTAFADFRLTFEVRLPAGAASRVSYRRSPDGEGPTLTFGHDAPKLSPKQPPFTPGEWHAVSIVARGEQQAATLDGKKWFDSSDEAFPEAMKQFRRGRIAFAADPSGKRVELRRIVLKPLALEPIFDGKSLEGWDLGRRRKSLYKVTDEGWLNVTNGPGDIQTEGVWGDFCLQLDIRVNGKDLNSGVFFRCIPDQFWQGYESQIKNAWKDGDRSKPVDYGTGGIYRRQPARWVVADDGQWFTKTVIAHDRHLAVWVNGVQVSDWTDGRPLHDNPRQGCRLKAGAVSFQGHDPTTDLSFRRIRIAEYPKNKQ
jgi:hypothetical protein